MEHDFKDDIEYIHMGSIGLEIQKSKVGMN
jgi:hypothetical protein